jgi:NADP-dependent 3-hydroxy acid dehydrogenase YdfG
VNAGALEGTIALITGASSGIGEATALAFAEHGAGVSLAARRVDRLEALAVRVRSLGTTVSVLQADVGSADQAREVVERTASELGRLDTLINNAG